MGQISQTWVLRRAWAGFGVPANPLYSDRVGCPPPTAVCHVIFYYRPRHEFLLCFVTGPLTLPSPPHLPESASHDKHATCCLIISVTSDFPFWRAQSAASGQCREVVPDPREPARHPWKMRRLVSQTSHCVWRTPSGSGGGQPNHATADPAGALSSGPDTSALARRPLTSAAFRARWADDPPRRPVAHSRRC